MGDDELPSPYRAIVEATSLVAIQAYDADARVVYWNEASERLYGYRQAEAVGRTLEALVLDEAGAAEFARLVTRLLRGEAPPAPREWRFRRKGGSGGWVLSTTFAVRTEGLVVCTDVDVTAHHEAEEALRQSEERYRTLVEYAPDAVVIFDLASGRFVQANAHAERLFGLPRARLCETGPIELSAPIAPDGRPAAEAAQENIARALAGEVRQFEWTHRDAAGRDIPCEVSLVRLPHPERQLVRGNISDISVRKRLEEQLRLAQKLEAIGRLAGGVAHDFNNLLTTILGNAQLAQFDRDGVRRAEHLGAIELAARMGAELTGQLLSFARRSLIAPTDVDLNEELSSAESLLRRTLGEDVELLTVTAPAPVLARADRGQLSQLILNLALNARDAMPSGGRLTLEVGEVDLDGTQPDVAPGRYAVLAVSDTGHGIPPEHLPHVFEPFFTTKGLGQGTGLGLATCYGIAKQHGGHISIYSEVGQGTTFRVYLPSADSRDASVAAPPAEPSAPRGTETVFVCEDDALVRGLLVRVLAEHGFQVVAEARPDELAARFRTHEGPIDLLVTDLVLPGQGGVALAAELRALRPTLRVLYISGYTENAVVHNGILEGGVHLLQKPFAPDELLVRVRAVLDG